MRFRGDKAYAPDPLASTIDDNAVDAGGAESASQASPPAVTGWTVQGIGWSLDGKRVRYHEFTLNKNLRVSATRSQLKEWFAGTDRIAFIVTARRP